MNLHEHSQTHNWEMGIGFTKQYDFEVYENVRKELSVLQSQSKLYTLKKKSLAEKSPARQDNINKTPQKLHISRKRHLIKEFLTKF